MSRLITVENTRRRMKNSNSPISASSARQGRGRGNFQARAFAYLLLAGGHHQGVAGEAVADLDVAGTALAQHHLGAHGAAVDDTVDELFVFPGEYRGFGHQQRVFAPLDDDLHAREQAGRELAPWIRDARAQADCPARDFDDRIDGVDLAFEHLAGPGVERNAYPLAAAHAGQGELGNTEIQFDFFDVGQFYDSLARC